MRKEKEKGKKGRRKKRREGTLKRGSGGSHLNTAEGEGRRPDVGAAGEENMYFLT